MIGLREGNTENRFMRAKRPFEELSSIKVNPLKLREWQKVKISVEELMELSGIKLPKR